MSMDGELPISDETMESPDAFTETFLGDIQNAPFEVGAFEDGDSLDTPSPTTDESPFADATTQVGDGTCIVCGAPTFRPPGLTPTGRKKRIPRYCDLHAPNSRVSTERSDFTGLESQLQRIQDELADEIRLLATLTGPLFPVTGFYLFEHADPFTIALLKLTKNNPKVLKIFYRAAQVAPVYTIAETVAGTAIAVQVDQKKIDPHGTIAERLHVDRAYDMVYPSESNGQTNNVTNNGYSPPPRYATVQ